MNEEISRIAREQAMNDVDQNDFFVETFYNSSDDNYEDYTDEWDDEE